MWQALREDKPDKGFSPNPLPPPTLMDISPTKTRELWLVMVMAPSSFSLQRTIVCRALVSGSTTATTTITNRYIKARDTRSGLWLNSGYVLEQTHQQLCLSIIDSNSLFLLVFSTRHKPTSNTPKLVAFAAVFGVSPNSNSVEICE